MKGDGKTEEEKEAFEFANKIYKKKYVEASLLLLLETRRRKPYLKYRSRVFCPMCALLRPPPPPYFLPSRNLLAPVQKSSLEKDSPLEISRQRGEEGQLPCFRIRCSKRVRRNGGNDGRNDSNY